MAAALAYGGRYRSGTPIHFTAVSGLALAMPGLGTQAIDLGHMGVWNVVVRNGAGTTTYGGFPDGKRDACRDT